MLAIIITKKRWTVNVYWDAVVSEASSTGELLPVGAVTGGVELPPVGAVTEKVELLPVGAVTEGVELLPFGADTGG